MQLEVIQVAVFFAVTAAIALVTYLKCRQAPRSDSDSNRDYFLAGGGLSWIFIAGSITLTNLSTDQLVGMNGNQMMLMAWWEISAVLGLIILAKIFLPQYYKHRCTTTTELLEKRYNNRHIRALIGGIFLLAIAFIWMPAAIYSGSLFMQNMFQVDIPLIVIAAAFALLGGAYAFFGGLRAVAVSDTYSGILLLGMAIMVVILSLQAIDYDFSGIPADRLTMIGDDDSPIPWTTLLTGMIFIQTFYWSTNQVITQRAMAAPSLKEAQKGVFAAAGIRLLIVPAIVVLPGIVAYKLYGDIGDAAYGRLVGELLPHWLSGIFAAALAAAVLTTYNSNLNSAVALYVCDIHENYVNKDVKVSKISAIVTVILVANSLLMVPMYQKADSIINLLQQLWGLLSMPILSIFIVGLMFRNVEAKAGMAAVVMGVFIYAFFSFVWTPIHYIHLMLVTLVLCVCIALTLNRLVFGNRAELVWRSSEELAPAV
ncbi:SLC5 family protein [Pseudomaricurvus alkylphenolicus]|uniref:SLC5 family protein n=1 Tax=Pseudomaricurvus alkylphenolicus TaxID=1306991 RepID=UPI001423CD84|nr:SLC5 family protein [Pseudomaricurvus alkylphenolicus]NIB44203.1 SLC5 family protein [Pseudomaricurvus alkylphenolicus]